MTSLHDKIKQLVRSEIRDLAAYHVPDSAGLIKLDAMENPWPMPESLRAAWLDALRAVDLNRYPDPLGQDLKSAMRKSLGIPESAAVVLGNGSDELIQMIVQTVAAPGRVILAPEPSFAMYRQIAVVNGLDYHGVPLAPDYALDPDAMLTAIAKLQPAVIFLAYPNNPTGNLFKASHIDAILSQSDGLVVLDEAYAPFTDASFLPQLEAHGNLLVLRTLSKMGLAGLRLGLLAGAPAWLEQIDKTRLPYNISSVNQVTGCFALAHDAVFTEQARLIRENRSMLLAGLQDIRGLTVYPSEANFILFRVPSGTAAAVFDGLKAAGVLIKKLDGSATALADCLRVTVGQPEENAVFLQALTRLTGK